MTPRGRPKVVIVARPFDVSASVVDAFVQRRRQVLGRLRSEVDLEVVLVRQPHDDSQPAPEIEPLVRAEVATPVPPNERAARLRRAWRTSADLGSPPARALAEAVVAEGARAAITFGPWLDAELVPVFAALPTVHFFEEDLQRMEENASQSTQAVAFRSVERRLRGRSTAQPRVVVHIAEREQATVRSLWPRAQPLLFPYLLEESAWPRATSVSRGDAVLVVGNFAEERNAGGLEAVLQALATAGGLPKMTLVSAAGLTDSLARIVARHPQIDLLRGIDDVYGLYRNHRCSLVPATRVTGVKTTVLQAWSAGCPVVCFPASAASIGVEAFDACFVGAEATDVAAQVMRVMGSSDDADRRRVAESALAVLQAQFETTRNAETLRRALMRLVEA